MYVLDVQLRVKAHKRDEFLQTIRSLQFNQDDEEEVMNLRLFEREDDQTAFSLTDLWETEEDFVKCVAGEKFRVLLGALQILCEESEIRYYPDKSDA